MNKTIIWCLFIAVMAACSQQENRLVTAKPEKVGMSSKGLNRIKPVMQKYIDEKKLPGMITMVARHGKVVHFETYGLMDVDKPMQLDAILVRKTVDLMTSNHISNEIMPNDNFFGPLLTGMGFGFGFAVLQDPIRSNIIGSKGSYLH